MPDDRRFQRWGWSFYLSEEKTMPSAILQQGVLRLSVLLAFLPVIFRPSAAAAQAVSAPPAPLSASPTRRLTLEEARQLALANNKALGLARLNMKEKYYAKTAAWKDYFPKLLGNVTYFHFNDNLGQVLTAKKGALGILSPGAIPIEVTVLNRIPPSARSIWRSL